MSQHEHYKKLIEEQRLDTMRQMVIQLQCANMLREKTKVNPFEKSWIAFASNWPSYVALAGMPSRYELGVLLCNYFPLAHIAYQPRTYCLLESRYAWKSFRIGGDEDLIPGSSLFLLEIDEDWKKTLHNICQALQFVGYEFGIENPVEEYEKLTYSTV